MIRNQALQQAMPVRCKRFGKEFALGWDGNLCVDLTAYGYRLMAHPGVFCAHYCPEVMAYESSLRENAVR